MNRLTMFVHKSGSTGSNWVRPRFLYRSFSCVQKKAPKLLKNMVFGKLGHLDGEKVYRVKKK